MGGRHSEKQGDAKSPSPSKWPGNFGRPLVATVSVLGIGILLVFNDYWLANIGYGMVLLAAVLLMPLCLLLRDLEIASRPSESATGEQLLSQTTDNLENQDGTEILGEPSRALANRKILLVTSDRSDRHAIRSYLDSWGAESKVSPNAVRSFSVLISAADRQSSFHTVIVDQGQFDMDPGQYSIALRSEPLLQHLYLILVGPKATHLQRERLQQLGYTKILPVPLDKTLLFDALHNTHSLTMEPGNRVVRFIDHYAGAANHQPLSILLADNNPSDQQRMRSILQRQGHQVFTVDSGARVLDALDSYRFDLAIVFIELREINGLEAFKLYRFTRIDNQRTPFILLLDRSTRTLVQSCIDSGVNATLEKGTDPRRVIELVNRVVRESNENIGINADSSYSYPTYSLAGIKADGSSLDFHRLRELEKLGGGTSFLSDLIDSFNRDNRKILNQMEKSLQSGDQTRFQDLGHAIKDSAGSLGAVRLYQLGTAATRLRPGDFPGTATELVQKITECCRLSNNALQDYLQEKDRSESDGNKE